MKLVTWRVVVRAEGCVFTAATFAEFDEAEHCARMLADAGTWATVQR